MRNKGVYLVIAFFIIFIFFLSSYNQNWTKSPANSPDINLDLQAGGNENDLSTPGGPSMIDLTPDAGNAETVAGSVNSSDSTSIDIVLETGSQPSATPVLAVDNPDQNNLQQDSAQEDSQPNPVLAFFSTLATTIESNFTDKSAQANQVSIEVGNEDENTDKDVTHEVTIDVEKYPIINSANAAILIYHTHTREAYTPEFPGQYVPIGNFRTDDNQNNVSAVGQKLADLLTGQYGFSVMHDTTMNEATPFTASYDKSLVMMKNDITQNPNLGIFIDVHRDSLGESAKNIEKARNDILTQDGKQYAKVMFVVGRGDGYTGAEAPDWQANYALAQAVSDQINQIMPGLSRGIMVKQRRYNQQLSNKSMLIEFGYDANTITQAENSADIVAQAIATVLNK